MINLRLFVKIDSNPMTTKLVNNTVAFCFCITVNHKTYIPKTITGLYLLNSKIEAVKRSFNQIIGSFANRSNGIHARGIAIITI